MNRLVSSVEFDVVLLFLFVITPPYPHSHYTHPPSPPSPPPPPRRPFMNATLGRRIKNSLLAFPPQPSVTSAPDDDMMLATSRRSSSIRSPCRAASLASFTALMARKIRSASR